MPELPEVEIARRSLARWAAGRRVEAVRVPDPGAIRTHLSTRPSDALPDGPARLARSLVGARAEVPRRHGKRLGWAFTDPGAAVLAHLGMSGRFVHGDRTGTFRHGRLALDLDDGTTVWFVDPRRFGGFTPIAPERLTEAIAEGLGPDALADRLSADALRERLAGRRAIKVALLDQAKIAGVGNIQAAEVLWRARVHPEARATDLDEDAWERLAAVIPAQLERVVAAEDDGELRYLQEAWVDNPFEVYGRVDQPCPRCATPIARAVQAGRATFWCPGCQRRPTRDTGAGRSSR